MEKINILALSILIISSSNFILGNEPNTNNQVDNNNIQEQICQEDQNNNTISRTDATDYEIDEFDRLVHEAEINNIPVVIPAKPTYLENIARKIGLILVLNPYIFIVSNYRITKKFVIKYASMAWETIVGKKPEVVTDGKQQ